LLFVVFCVYNESSQPNRRFKMTGATSTDFNERGTADARAVCTPTTALAYIIEDCRQALREAMKDWQSNENF
jgi:hypothetical protein